MRTATQHHPHLGYGSQQHHSGGGYGHTPSPLRNSAHHHGAGHAHRAGSWSQPTRWIFLMVVSLMALNTIWFTHMALYHTGTPARTFLQHPLTAASVPDSPPPPPEAPEPPFLPGQRVRRHKPLFTASTTLTFKGPCNLSDSPFRLNISGTNVNTFEPLAAFLRNNTLMLEDMSPASYWRVKLLANPNNTGDKLAFLKSIEFNIEANHPLMPHPKPLLNLYSVTPNEDVDCALARVAAQWNHSHDPITQRLFLDNSLRHTAGHGLGEPQGMFMRLALPPLMQAVEERSGGTGGRKGAKAAARSRAASSVQQGVLALPPEAAASLAQPAKILIQADDRFHGGDRHFAMRSMTKALVAAVIMALQDRGLLSDLDPVSKHLPEFGSLPYAGMTLAMLLAHTAGYENVYKNEFVLEPANITLGEAALRSQKHVKLVGMPGKKFCYTEVGYVVLGAVVEAVTKRSFHSVLEELLLVPLGMCDTRVINYWNDPLPTHGPLIPNCVAPGSPAARARRAAAHTHGGHLRASDVDLLQGPLFVEDLTFSTNPTLAFGGITTPNDVERFSAMLANGGVSACCAGVGIGQGGAGAQRARRGWSLWGGSKAERGAGGGDAGRLCRCGVRVLSDSAVRLMVSRKPTPGLPSTDLVRGFTKTTPYTAQLIAEAGLLDDGARKAWLQHMWGDFGYAYGLWVTRSNATGEDHAWMFGAFNTVAGLLRMSPESKAAQLAAAAGRAGLPLVYHGTALSSINLVWGYLTGYFV